MISERTPTIIGNRYGRLTVISEAPKRNRNRMFVCKCDCGNTTKPILAYSLKAGKTTSCGCYGLERAKEAHIKHGDRHSRLYNTWCNIKQRCYNSNMRDYRLYGGRGIVMCDEWKNDYAAFKEWALSNGYDETAPRGACTIDRIDNNGIYSPDNCRIASQKTQCNNLRKNLLIEIDGRTQTLKQWADESGLDESKIRYRYHHGYKGRELLQNERCHK